MRSIAQKRTLVLPVLLLCTSITPAASAAENAVRAARHEGTVTSTSIRWQSVYVLRADASETLDLAYPLSAGTALEPSDTVSPVLQAGRIVGFRRVDPSRAERDVHLALTEPLDRNGKAMRLAPPLAFGDAVQIVDMTGGR